MFAVGTLLPAQGPRLEARLAADPSRTGPPAWTWARELAARTLGGIDDPFDALLVGIDADGDIAVGVDPDAVDGAPYLRFELRVGDRTPVAGECDRQGHARWQVREGVVLADLPGPVRAICSRFGYEARTGWLTLDLSTAVGNLMAAATDGDAISEALTIGASECGSVAVLARRGDDGSLAIEGNSEGGLLLPALLIALADRQSGRVAARTAPPLADDLERWLLVAASAVREEQEEAARQLGRFRDPRAVRALERLLRGEGLVRLIAMHGLVRQGATTSLGAIVAAADPRQPGTVSLAAQAVWSLAPESVRREMLGSVPASTGPTGTGLASTSVRSPAPDLLGALWATCGALALGSAGGLLFAARRRRAALAAAAA